MEIHTTKGLLCLPLWVCTGRFDSFASPSSYHLNWRYLICNLLLSRQLRIAGFKQYTDLYLVHCRAQAILQVKPTQFFIVLDFFEAKGKKKAEACFWARLTLGVSLAQTGQWLWALCKVWIKWEARVRETRAAGEVREGAILCMPLCLLKEELTFPREVAAGVRESARLCSDRRPE